MSGFSRWMPPAPRAHRAIRYPTLALLLAAAVWLVLRYPWVLLAASAVLGLSAFADRNRRRRLRFMRRQRAGESLCTFARAFPRHERDAWVLRAVWQALQPHCGSGPGTMPLRPTDRLREDLGIDSEDLELSLVTVAARAGRDLANYEANPFYGRLQTVGNLVQFLQAQPRRVAA